MTEQELIAFFQDLHRHPELAFQEKRTTQKVKDALEKAGIQIVPSGMETGLIAVIHGDRDGGVIGLRADMDALPVTEETNLPYASCQPGIMHACGHDFHTACMLGAALMLNERKGELRGTVKIVFQPAEEIAKGAENMASLPILQDVREFYASHTYPGFPAGTLGIKAGPVMAAPDRFLITIRGRGAHAGNPHQGIDPIPAAAALIQGAQALISRSKDAFEPAVLSITRVQAGSTWNVMPEEAEIEGTLRTLNEQVRRTLIEKLQSLARHTAESYGCTAKCDVTLGPGPVVNDEALCDFAHQTALDMGFAVERQENTMGGEDFSAFLRRAPGAFIRIGTGGGIPNHHPQFTADPAALYPAARFFAELALRRAGLYA